MLHRSDDGGASWHELGCRRFRPMPRGAPSLFQVLDVCETGGARAARRGCGAARLPRGLFRSDDRGATLAARRIARERARARYMVRRRLRSTPASIGIARSARSGSCSRRRSSCGGVWDTATTARAGAAGDGLRRRLHAARAGRRLRASGPASRGRAAPPRPTCCGCQHHADIFRSPTPASTWTRSSRPRDDSLRGRGASRAIPIRASSSPASKDEIEHAASTAALVVTRSRVGGASSRCCATACRSATRRPRSTATAATSMPAATSSRWVSTHPAAAADGARSAHRGSASRAWRCGLDGSRARACSTLARRYATAARRPVAAEPRR